MSGKSKASDRTNLGAGAATINCQYNPVKLKFTILLFLEQPFYENYLTLDSRDTRPFTRQDGFQNSHQVYSVAYGSTKLSFFYISKQPSILCLCFFVSPVQIKYRTFCIFRFLEYSVYSVSNNIPCIPLFRRTGSPKYRGGHHKKRLRVGFLNR